MISINSTKREVEGNTISMCRWSLGRRRRRERLKWVGIEAVLGDTKMEGNDEGRGMGGGGMDHGGDSEPGPRGSRLGIPFPASAETG